MSDESPLRDTIEAAASPQVALAQQQKKTATAAFSPSLKRIEIERGRGGGEMKEAPTYLPTGDAFVSLSHENAFPLQRFPAALRQLAV